MPERNPSLTRTLKSILEAECKLYTEYNSVLAREEALLHSLKHTDGTEEIAKLSAKREEMLKFMEALHKARTELLKELPGPKDRKLSDIVAQNFHAVEAKELDPLVNQLRDLVRASQLKGIEFSQVLGFSRNILNGLLSIFWSATENVVRSYNPSGALKESFHPNSGRKNRVLKEA